MSSLLFGILRWFVVAALVLGFFFLLIPSVVTLHRVQGSSDAPNLLPGDWILVHRAAYDWRLRGVKNPLAELGNPERGDIALLLVPGSGNRVTKRIAAVPGDTIAVIGHRVQLNGDTLTYEPLDTADFAWIPETVPMGAVFAGESGLGYRQVITYTPLEVTEESERPLEGSYVLDADEYFVLGDNRDHSLDSRTFGVVPRERILGRVLGTLVPAAKEQ